MLLLLFLHTMLARGMVTAPTHYAALLSQLKRSLQPDAFTISEFPGKYSLVITKWRPIVPLTPLTPPEQRLLATGDTLTLRPPLLTATRELSSRVGDNEGAATIPVRPPRPMVPPQLHLRLLTVLFLFIRLTHTYPLTLSKPVAHLNATSQHEILSTGDVLKALVHNLHTPDTTTLRFLLRERFAIDSCGRTLSPRVKQLFIRPGILLTREDTLPCISQTTLLA